MQTTETVTFAGRPIPLKRPLAYFAANRLQAILPQIAALNAAGKSQADAAAALGVSVYTLRTWLDLTSTPWTNLKKRGPYKTMPNANFQFVNSVTFLGRIIPLTKPIAIFNARRLEALLPQMAALNAARKTKQEAAAVLGVTGQTLATYVKITQTTWLGKVRKPKDKCRNPVKHRAVVKAWRSRNREKHLAMKRRQYLNRKARLAASHA
jgi:hypothetical protein